MSLLSETSRLVRLRYVDPPPLPKPCRRLSAHTAFQGGGSTGLGLLRHPPHPLGSARLPLWPFVVS